MSWGGLGRSSVSLSDLPINPPPPDDEDDEDGFPPPNKFDPNQLLSTPPSPFLSMQIYKECHRMALEQVCFFFSLKILVSYIYHEVLRRPRG